MSTRVWSIQGVDSSSETVDVVHRADLSNPHQVTKTQVGLGNADNTSDVNKPISTATQTALDLKASAAGLSAHIADVANPHVVTQTQVGLSNVTNTSDANKPVSIAQQAALDLKQNIHANLTAVVTTGAAATVLTSDGVGGVSWTSHTSHVDELADLDDVDVVTYNNRKALIANGTLFQSRLLVEADISDLATYALSSALTSHTGNTSNPHSVTATQVGLGNVANRTETQMVAGPGAIFDAFATKSGTGHTHSTGSLTGDTDGLTDTATNRFATDGQLAQIATNTSDIADRALTTTLTSHTSNTSNPHTVTATQVGLGNADNTSDANKPVSTATQTALNLKQAQTTELTDLSDVSAVTVGYIPIVNATQDGYDFSAHDAIGGMELTDLDDVGTVAYTNRHVLVADGTDYDSRLLVEADISNLGTYAVASHNHDATYGAIADVATNTTHRGRTDNPHAVTKTQVGLGNVADKSEAQMVASGAIYDELLTKRLVIGTQTISASTGTVTGTSDELYVIASYAGAGAITLPTAVAGRRVTVHRTYAGALTVNPGASDDFFNPAVPGTTATVAMSGKGTTVFVAMDATTWYVVSNQVHDDQSNKPYFHIRKTNGQTVAHATMSVVTWDVAATVDTHSAFASNVYTIPKTGYYRIHFIPDWVTHTDFDGKRNQSVVSANLSGAGYADIHREYTTPYIPTTDTDIPFQEPKIDWVSFFTVNDLVRIRVRHTRGSDASLNVNGNTDAALEVCWTMEYIGP